MSSDRKREAPRMDTACEIWLRDPQGELIGVGSVLNLAEGGVFVTFAEHEIVERRNVGDPLRFEFRLPTGEVRGTGKVAWLEPDTAKLGVRFSGIDNEDGLANLMAYVHSAFCGAE